MDTRSPGNPGGVALPGQSPARPIVDILFGVRLHRYGIDAHSGRNTGALPWLRNCRPRSLPT